MLAQPPAFGAPTLRPPVVIREELANGLAVWIVEQRDAPFESIAYVDRAARDDAAEESRGLALFSADALARGSNELARASTPLVGTALEGSLGDAGTSLRITVEAAWADAAMARLAAAIRRPRLTPKLLEDVRRAELAAIASTERSGRALLTGLAAEQLYGAQSPATRSLLGTSHKVNWFVVDDVQRFLRGHYGPRTAALVLVGALDRAGALALAVRHFGDWQASSSESPPQGPVTVSPTAPKGLSIWAVDGGQGQAMMAFAWPCPRAVEPEALAFGLLGSLLGGMVRSRIFVALRETEGLSYHVFARCVERRESATFMLTADAPSERVVDALRMTLYESSRVANVQISEEELEMAKASVLADTSRKLGSTEGVAEQLGALFLARLPHDHYATLEQRVRAVSAADVLSVARRYLGGARGVAVGAEAYWILRYLSVDDVTWKTPSLSEP